LADQSAPPRLRDLDLALATSSCCDFHPAGTSHGDENLAANRAPTAGIRPGRARAPLHARRAAPGPARAGSHGAHGAFLGRPSRAAGVDWANVEADVAALPPAPALVRSVSIVVMAAVGEPVADLPELERLGDSARVDVVVARPQATETLAAAASRAAERTKGELLCFFPASTSTLENGWLARLAAVVDGSAVVCAAPLVVHPMRSAARATPDDGRVRALGLRLDVSSDAPVMRAREAGTRPAVGAPPATVPGATAACLLVDRRAYASAGALPDLGDLDLSVFDLCRRLRARGGEIVAVPAAIAVDHRPVGSRAALAGPLPIDDPAWRAYVEEHGPELMREASPLPRAACGSRSQLPRRRQKVAPRWVRLAPRPGVLPVRSVATPPGSGPDPRPRR
jgi:hypothetical protein